MQGSTYTQPRHYEEVEWLVLSSAAFNPPGKLPSFYRRLSEPSEQVWIYEIVENKLRQSFTRDRTRAVQPIDKRFVAWATCPIDKTGQILKESLERFFDKI